MHCTMGLVPLVLVFCTMGPSILSTQVDSGCTVKPALVATVPWV
jgi:hypothetical protein